MLFDVVPEALGHFGAGDVFFAPDEGGEFGGGAEGRLLPCRLFGCGFFSRRLLRGGFFSRGLFRDRFLRHFFRGGLGCRFFSGTFFAFAAFVGGFGVVVVLGFEVGDVVDDDVAVGEVGAGEEGFAEAGFAGDDLAVAADSGAFGEVGRDVFAFLGDVDDAAAFGVFRAA